MHSLSRYFNAALSREEGRRVPLTLGAKGPNSGDIERALKRLGIACQTEEHHHPAHWGGDEGTGYRHMDRKKRGAIKKIAPGH